MFYALYSILGFGLFLSCLFEGEGLLWSTVAGIVWPLVFARVVYVRWTDGG